MSLPEPPLLLISDRHQALVPLQRVAAAAFGAGARWLMLREKDLDAKARLGLLEALVEVAKPFGAVVTVNGDIAAAKAAGAAGVHLPSDGDVGAARATLGPRALIGASAHDVAEATAFSGAGANYVTLSPIFASVSKPGYGPPLGLEALRAATAVVPCPVVALGGVTPETAPACITVGAAGIAVMGPVMRAPNPGRTVATFLTALRRESGR